MSFINAILRKRFLIAITLGLLFALLLFRCKNLLKDKTKRVSFGLSPDSGMVEVRGLDYAILHDLQTDSASEVNLKSLFPVYRMPQDTDMKDLVKALAGKYSVGDSTLTFKPDTPFKKHCQYFARFYSGGLANSQQALVQSRANITTQKYQEFRFGM